MGFFLKNVKIISSRWTKQRAILLLFFCLSISPQARPNPIPDLDSGIVEIPNFDSILGPGLPSKSTANQDDELRKTLYQAPPTSVRASVDNSITPSGPPTDTTASPATPAKANSTVAQSPDNSASHNQPPGSPPGHSNDDDDGSPLSSGAIAAIVISSIIGFLIILSVLAMSLRGIEHSIEEEKERKRAKESRQSKRLNPAPAVPVGPAVPAVPDVVDSQPQSRDSIREV